MSRKAKATPGHNSAAAGELRSFVERLERLDEEIKSLKADRKDVAQEAKSRGFSAKAVENIIKRRGESSSQRAERQEVDDLTEIYASALGMLDGTPLGDSARERLSRKPASEKPEQDTEDDPGEMEPEDRPTRSTITPEDIAASKEAGREAFRGGKRVIDNPFIAGDPRRAAWDEGWCFEAGSDGMDIPPAWRRSEKPKKDDKPADGDKGE